MGERVGILDRVRGAAGVADEELLRRSRSGDRAAFAELWRRHAHAGAAAARAMTHLDADDLVSEAFERILRLVLDGRGPTGAFRPYLYTTIRHLAASHGRSRREVAVDDLEDLIDIDFDDDVAVIALDRSLTAQAFRSLPERWQAVLWYTEVEGLDPHEAAPLLGLNANATAALSFRAREGLRVAWLQAHVDDAHASGECRWATEHLGEHERHKLSARDTDRLAFHLANCARCSIISEEVHDVGVRLRSVLLPLVMGAGAALGLDEQAASASDAVFAGEAPGADTSLSTHAMPEHFAAIMGASSVGLGAIVTKVAAGAVIVVVGAAAPVSSTFPVDDTAPTSVEEPQGPSVAAPALDELPVASIPLPTEAATSARELVGGAEDLAQALIGTITGDALSPGHTAPGGIVGADLDIVITGTATPGAKLSLQGAGQVYATTTARSDGTFTIAATAVPDGLSSLELVQFVDSRYLESLLHDGGLIEGFIKPIALGSNDSSITIVLVQ